MKSFTFLIALAGFAPSANAQVYSPNWGSALNRAMAGPNTANMVWRASQDRYGRQYDGPPYGSGYYDAYGQPYGYYGSLRNQVVRGVVAGAVAGTIVAASYRDSHDRPLAGPSNSRNNNSGEFALSNQTRYSVEVWFGKGKGKYIGRLASGESWSIKGPKKDERYSGFALIPASNGSLANDEVPIQPTQNGWTFVEPDYVRQGR